MLLKEASNREPFYFAACAKNILVGAADKLKMMSIATTPTAFFF